MITALYFAGALFALAAMCVAGIGILAILALIAVLYILYYVLIAMWYIFVRPMIENIIGHKLKERDKPVGNQLNIPIGFHFSKPLSQMTGLEYEHEVARWLSWKGYHAVKVTPASNDFGADIVAKDKNGKVWVFQCKLYSSTLGNGPVQEVVAAKAHYGANQAAVVTNSAFSKAAKQLAEENNVKLITLK